MAEKTPAFKHTRNWDEFWKEYGPLVESTEKDHSLPKGLLGRLLWAESRGNTRARSAKGAVGVAQLLEGTAKDVGVTDREDPRQAIPGAAKYLQWLGKRLQTNDIAKLVGAYNYGPERMGTDWPARIPLETRDYVRVVAGTDPWPGRDFGPKGDRPSTKALEGNLPAFLRPQVQAPKPAEVAAAPSLPVATLPPKEDPAGPLTSGLRQAAGPAAPLPVPQPVPIQAQVYFTPDAQAANARDAQFAGELDLTRRRAELTAGEKYDAAVRLQHVAPSIALAAEERIARAITDPNWTAPSTARIMEDLQRGGISPGYAPRLLEARSASHYAAIYAQLEQESKAEEVLNTSGFWSSLGYGTLGALTDPAMAALNFSSLGLPAFARAGALGARALKGGAWSVGVAMASEAPLQLTQETRDAHEAAYTILGSLFLGGAGAAVSPASNALRNVGYAVLNSNRTPDEELRALADPVSGSISATLAQLNSQQLRIAQGDAMARLGLVGPERPFEPNIARLRNPEPRMAGTIELSPRGPGGEMLPAEEAGSITVAPAERLGGFETGLLERSPILDALEAATPKPPKKTKKPKKEAGAVTVEEPEEPKPLPLTPAEQAAAAALATEGKPKRKAKAKAAKQDPGGITVETVDAPAVSVGQSVTWADGTQSGIVSKVLEGGKIIVEPAEGGTPKRLASADLDPFGPNTAGSAQVSGYEINGVDLPASTTPITPSAWGARWLRFDPAGWLKNTKNVVFHVYGHRVAADGVGINRDGSAALAAAEEVAHLERTRREVSALRALDLAFHEYDAGGPMLGKRKRRQEFNALAVQAYDGGVNTSQFGPDQRAALDSAVAALRDYFEGWRTHLLGSGSDYGKNLTQGGRHYAPHIINFRAFRDAAAKHGRGRVANLVAKSMEARYLHLNGMAIDGALRAAFVEMAKGYVDGVLRRGYWGDLIGVHGIDPSNRPGMRALLEAVPGITPERIEEVLQIVERTGSGGDGPARFRHRFEFDMSYTDPMTGMRLGDLYVRDAGDLITMYGRQVAGHAALAQVAGIRSRAHHEALKVEAARRHVGDDDELRKGLQYMDYLYNGITGKPFEDDPASAFNVWGRRLRDFNFLRLMNQVGFAQVAEFGRILSVSSWGAMYRQMPVLKDVLKLAKDRKLANPLLRELEAATGMGTHRFLGTFVSHTDDTIEGQFGSKVDDVLHAGKTFVADISGMSLLTTVQQRMAMAAAAQNIADKARKGQVDDALLRSLGLTPDDWGFVQRELLANARMGSGHRLHELNLEDWDPEASNLFATAIHRAVRRAIQENDLGNTLPFMHRTLGQILFQFRSFGMGAIFKQTMQGLAQRDVLTAQAFLLTTLAGGLSYVIQTYINEPDPDKLEEKLTPERIGLAAFNRSGYMSMIPAVTDSLVAGATAGSVPGVFNGRTTQNLGADFITGNPSVDLANKAVRALAATPNAVLRDDYDYSRADMRAQVGIIPFHNAIGLNRAFRALGEDLPRESVETESNHFGQ